MEVKPSKGVRVAVNANREAIFGDDSVSMKKVSISPNSKLGELTGLTLAGYCEVEMPKLDGKKHWYPIDDLVGEKGEKVVEEEIPLEDEEPAEVGAEQD